jgi:hypothetical protein
MKIHLLQLGLRFVRERGATRSNDGHRDEGGREHRMMCLMAFFVVVVVVYVETTSLIKKLLFVEIFGVDFRS